MIDENILSKSRIGRKDTHASIRCSSISMSSTFLYEREDTVAIIRTISVCPIDDKAYMHFSRHSYHETIITEETEVNYVKN